MFLNFKGPNSKSKFVPNFTEGWPSQNLPDADACIPMCECLSSEVCIGSFIRVFLQNIHVYVGMYTCISSYVYIYMYIYTHEIHVRVCTHAEVHAHLLIFTSFFHGQAPNLADPSFGSVAERPDAQSRGPQRPRRTSSSFWTIRQNLSVTCRCVRM